MADIQKLPNVAKDQMAPTKPVIEQEVKESNTTEHETVPLDFSSLTIDEVTQIRKAYQLIRRENERNSVKRKITLDITYTKGVKVGKTQLFVEYADGQGGEPPTLDPVNRYPGPEACRKLMLCEACEALRITMVLEWYAKEGVSVYKMRCWWERGCKHHLNGCGHDAHYDALCDIVAFSRKRLDIEA
ncbi:hypothetical protein LTR49_010574 [Elasticomyces elasticus]|nr:hypothetical protein LTR49_010574 [Elasticomyces elasticus]